MKLSRRTSKVGCAAGALAVVPLTAGIIWLAATATAAAPERDLRLPRLQPDVPTDLRVDTIGSAHTRRVLLRFTVAIANTGTGPLIVIGHRPPRSSTMSAYQIVERADGSTLATPAIGHLRYVRAGGHEHWHLSGFARYTLRALRPNSRVMRDSKIGFCLGDDYAVNGDGAAPTPLFLYVTCGRGQPRERAIAEGITQGYGDVYPATKAGQAFDITHLHAGAYVLTVTVDPRHRLRTADASSQSAAVIVALRLRQRPAVTVIRRCSTAKACA